jgi:hypothetical protein
MNDASTLDRPVIPASGANREVHRLQVVGGRAWRKRGARTQAVSFPFAIVRLSALQRQFDAQILSVEQGIREQRRELLNAMANWRSEKSKFTGGSPPFACR